jgi:hypothetical protein
MKAKLNIFVRDRTCALVAKSAHYHIYDCHRRQIIPTTWFSGGHVEVTVPPGCYQIVVGVYNPGGNLYTDIAMVIVRCGDDACVNLVLNDYRYALLITDTTTIAPMTLAFGGCGARGLMPFLINAAKADLKPEEIKRTFDVLTRAAGLEQKTVKQCVKEYISEMEHALREAPPDVKEDLKDFKAHVKFLNEYLLQKE